jgi:hypothetical protein
VTRDEAELPDLLVRAFQRLGPVVVDNLDPDLPECLGEPLRVVGDDDEVGPVRGDGLDESVVFGAAFG